jgi:antitoxin MazE
MQTRIQKWGNSLALRIPKPLADEIGLKDNSSVELSRRENVLVIVPLVQPGPSLAELLAQITDANLHQEIDTGPAVGGETW